MAELRKDPILGDWVIMAPDRATRPFDHDSNDDSLPPEPCPFCRGDEAATPEAVLTVADDKTPDDWTVRIIPNRYPAVMVSPSANIDQTPEFFERTAARGYHEVIIESPSHHQASMSIHNCWRHRSSPPESKPNSTPEKSISSRQVRTCGRKCSMANFLPALELSRRPMSSFCSARLPAGFPARCACFRVNLRHPLKRKLTRV